MSSHFLVDKSLALEARFSGYYLANTKAFAEPGVEPHYGPSVGFVLAHADIFLDIDPVARTLSGEATLTVRPRAGGLGDVVFHLADLVVDSVTDGEGKALSWRHDDDRLKVVTGPGKVRVRYHGQPRRGLYFTGPTEPEPHRPHMAWTQCQDEDSRYVFPCVDHPGHKFPMSVRIKAPEGYTVVGNGRPTGVVDGVWGFEQSEPIPAYLFTAVVARLEIVQDEWRGRSVRYLAPEGTSHATLSRVYGKTPLMLEHYSRTFGVDYPWPRYDQVVVHDFIFGGMENAAATTMTDLTLTDERAALDYDSEDLVSHELAHQWFGDLVTCADWSQAWLNESWATYCEYIWAMEGKGVDEADWVQLRHMELYLEEDGGRYRRPIVSYLFKAPIDVFDRHLYEKGSVVLHTLRGILGDEAFWAGVKQYLETHRGGSVFSRNFQVAMEQASGQNLDRFFKSWIHGAGHPKVSVKLSHRDGLLTVSVAQSQEGDDTAQAFAFPLTLFVVREGGEERIVLPVEERQRAWSIPCESEPVRVEVDPSFAVLAELEVEGPRSWLVSSLLRDRGIVGRIRAARALGKERSPAAIEALVGALSSDPFWGVRGKVAQVLAAAGGSRAREALLGALEDADPKARRMIVAALAGVDHPSVVDALSRIVAEGDESVQVEAEAATTLGALRPGDLIRRVAPLLERDSWGELLRARALGAIGASRDPAALPILLEYTAASHMERTRAAAASALGRLADELDGTRADAVERLVLLAKDSPFRLQLAAIAALGRARDPKGLAVLKDVHAAHHDGRMRRQAYESTQAILAGRTGTQALQTIKDELHALRDEHTKLRERIEKLER